MGRVKTFHLCMSTLHAFFFHCACAGFVLCLPWLVILYHTFKMMWWVLRLPWLIFCCVWWVLCLPWRTLCYTILLVWRIAQLWANAVWLTVRLGLHTCLFPLGLTRRVLVAMATFVWQSGNWSTKRSRKIWLSFVPQAHLSIAWLIFRLALFTTVMIFLVQQHNKPCSTPPLEDPCRFSADMSPYDILNVKRASSMQEIKSAHRRLALQCHPDKVPETRRAIGEEGMIRINNAYDAIRETMG